MHERLKKKNQEAIKAILFEKINGCIREKYLFNFNTFVVDANLQNYFINSIELVELF